MTEYTISWHRHELHLGRRTGIMGVLNVTPDSFSDGGKFHSPEAAVRQGEKMAADGADIIDIGGESTRPFSDPVSPEKELERVIPVIQKLSRRITVPISIDTTKAIVAEKAIAAGASMINDISALRMDPKMGALAADTNVPVILMHMRGDPKTMQATPTYRDLIAEILSFLQEAIQRAEKQHIPREKIIIDPGIGFGKTFGHNLMLIKNLNRFDRLGAPILVGPSRKKFIRAILKKDTEDDLPPDSPEVETGTQAVVAASIMNGAHIVRVHDVAATVATTKLVDAVVNAERSKLAATAT